MRIVERTKAVVFKLWKDESGASLLEYSVLIGLITAAVITTITSVGGKVLTAWETLDTNMPGAAE
jgi:pilus assembly protein Flp/PilA